MFRFYFSCVLVNVPRAQTKRAVQRIPNLPYFVNGSQASVTQLTHTFANFSTVFFTYIIELVIILNIAEILFNNQ